MLLSNIQLLFKGTLIKLEALLFDLLNLARAKCRRICGTPWKAGWGVGWGGVEMGGGNLVKSYRGPPRELCRLSKLF